MREEDILKKILGKNPKDEQDEIHGSTGEAKRSIDQKGGDFWNRPHRDDMPQRDG